MFGCYVAGATRKLLPFQRVLYIHQTTMYHHVTSLHNLPYCFTSIEARLPIMDGERVGRGRESEGSTAGTARKRPERPWTAARTMEVLRRCPLAIEQRLVHCVTAACNCRAGQSHKDNVRCTAVEEQPEAKEVQLSQSSSTSLHAHDLFWATLRVQLHLPAHHLFWANLRVQSQLHFSLLSSSLLGVQLHLPPLDLAWNPVSYVSSCKPHT